MILDVGMANTGATADEAAALEMIGGAEAIMAEQPARADRELRERPRGRIERHLLRAGELEVEFQMILQIGADTRQIVHDRNGVLHEFRGGTDSGELQQLRGV